VLVVVGILIALYINNWNEQRNKKKDLINKLEQVEDELVENIISANVSIERFRIKDSILRNVLNKKYSKSDYLKDPNLFTLILNINPYRIQSKSYNNFSSDYKSVDSEIDYIKQLLDNSFEKDGVGFVQFEQLTIEKMVSYSDYIVREKKWFYDLSMGNFENEDLLNYYLNDSQYLNEVLRYHSSIIRNLNPLLQQFRNSSRSAYLTIHKYLEENNHRHSDSLMFTYDSSNFNHYLGTFKDSVTNVKIYMEDDKLMCFYDEKGDTMTAEIIPINKGYFNTYWADGFYYFIFNEKDRVSALQWKRDAIVREYQKVN
jgi:hypothetical protein